VVSGPRSSEPAFAFSPAAGHSQPPVILIGFQSLIKNNKLHIHKGSAGALESGPVSFTTLVAATDNDSLTPFPFVKFYPQLET
jgi:hypothetical protein